MADAAAEFRHSRLSALVLDRRDVRQQLVRGQYVAVHDFVALHVVGE